MATQSVAPRSRRPLDTDDMVLARALEVAEWARRNVRMILIIAAVALAALLGLFWYRYQRAEKLETAAREYLLLEQSAQTGNSAALAQNLNSYIRRFDGTQYADEARLMLAQLHLGAGQPKQAIPVLQPLAERVGRSPVGTQGALLLAAAQQAGGDANAAIQTYLNVAEEAELDFQQSEALADAALLRQQAGDFAGAAELYRRLVDGAEEGSMERSVYEMRLAEAQAQAAAKQP